jgi:hypothetical protein
MMGDFSRKRAQETQRQNCGLHSFRSFYLHIKPKLTITPKLVKMQISANMIIT